MKKKIVHLSIIGIFCSLYFLVATISMINSVEFFDLAHSGLMSWSLALGFELGAAASLAAIVILEKTNRTMVWALFLLLTAFQMMANSYHAFVNLEDYMGWIELFGLQEEEVLFQKRILSVISGAVLPVVALGFIKSLIDYIRPNDTTPDEVVTYEREVPTPMKVPQQPITQQHNPSEDLVERVKENQAKLTEDPEVYEDYDSEGNIIIPPRVVEKSTDAIEEAGTTPYVPSTPKKNPNVTKTKPDPIMGRRIVGGKGHAGKPYPRV